MSQKEPKMDPGQAQNLLNAYNERKGTHYRIGEYCGGGALGAVFRIPDTHPSMVVKISEDGGDSRLRKLCRREIQIMEHLGPHPNIMPLLDSLILPEGETRSPGNVYLLFMPEYLPLADWITQKGSLSEQELCQIAMDMCKALMHCESRQVLHRDLKPGNIFVAQDENGPRYILGDYNISRCFTEKDTGPITSLGTDGFASPEVMRSKADQKAMQEHPGQYQEATLEPGCYNSDVYILGVTLYYMITDGELPTLRYRTGAFSRELPRISEEFEQIIWKAVRYQPRQRYSGAADMLAKLERLEPRDQMVCQNNYFIWAKEALLGRKWTIAQDLASMGVSQDDARCRRLLAYCRYHELRKQFRDQAKAGEPMAQEDFQAVAECIEEELYAMYQERQDVASLLLGALIHQHRGMHEDYTHVKLAAEQGYPPAQFFWGQHLCGQLGSRDGYPFLIGAAEAGFPAAMRYVKKYRDLGCLPGIDTQITEGLRTSLESIRVDGKGDYFGDVIRFL